MDEAGQSSPFVETMPPRLAEKLRTLVAQGEAVRLQVAADMKGGGSFGQPWLVATEQRVLLFGTDGGGAVVEVPLTEIAQVRVEGLVGGGRLEVERKQGEPVYLCYSSSLAAKFAEVAGGLQRLSKGEPLGLPTQVEQSRCAQCGRLLPEKGGICPFCIAKWDTIKRIAGYLRPYRGRVGALMGVSLVSTAAELLPPYLVKNIIDDVLTPRAGFALLAWFVAGLAAVRLVSFACEIGHGWLRAGVASWVSRDIRSQLYQNLQYLPLRFYDRRAVGGLISRFLNDADRLEMFLLFGIPYILTNALMLAGILGLLLYLSWNLTLYVLLPVPFIVTGGILIWDRMRHYWGRWSAKWSRFASHLNESITGIRVVKAFAQEEREAGRFDRRNDELRQINVSAERTWFVFWAAMNFLMSFGVFLVWYFGGRMILDEALTLGALMAFVSYIWQLYHPLQFLSELNNFVTRAFAGAEKVFEVIDARAEQAQDPQAVAMPRLEGRVAFKGVSFGYDPAKPVLKEVDLEVRSGEMIGLVGRSGVGKSTLVSLICRFYDVDQGELQIDGVDIRKIRLEDLRRQIGMVAQESFLFNGSIAENIAYGRPGAGFADIVRAARAANAHEFIVAKPDGYDTLVGERGSKLAGGEKQRVAIARAILHDPKILILDEATASVDTPTEKKIQEAIARLVAGRTTFAIAHRLSTLRRASRLVVLDDGKVAEVGTHEELMAREGIFYRLVRTQQETTAVMAVGGGKEPPA